MPNKLVREPATDACPLHRLLFTLHVLDTFSTDHQLPNDDRDLAFAAKAQLILLIRHLEINEPAAFARLNPHTNNQDERSTPTTCRNDDRADTTNAVVDIRANPTGITATAPASSAAGLGQPAHAASSEKQNRPSQGHQSTTLFP